MPEPFDAIVIGGGPGGSTAALMLARAGWRIVLVEKTRFPRRKVCGEYISATNLPLFQQLGVVEEFQRQAGPPVRFVGLFAGEISLTAPMPRPTENPGEWGRALGRERLDTALIERASNAGAQVWQPWAATRLEKRGDLFHCEVTDKETRQTRALRSCAVIAAHGSWEPGTLPTQFIRRAARSADLFGFKAHLRDTSLADDLMSLLVFPGGYGGMVHTDDRRVSLSICIRRDRLERLRRATPSASAAEVVFSHVRRSCRGVREGLAAARLEGAWLSAGPIHPGIRACHSEGLFRVGNAAGEAHPIIAEGISMAMQSAWLLCDRLVAEGKNNLTGPALREIGKDYSIAWRKNFAARIRAAALFAQLAARPASARLLIPVLRLFPAALTLGARLSGKASSVLLNSEIHFAGRPAN